MMRRMAYVEVHPQGGGFQIRFVPPCEIEEPFVSTAAFVDPILGELGVRAIGPWEEATNEHGDTFQRALILG